MSVLGANHNWFNTRLVRRRRRRDRHRRGVRHEPAEQHPALGRHVRPHHSRLGRSRADGRPGEGRPGDDVGVLPPLRRRRRRVRPVHDGRDQRRRHDAAAAGVGLPDLSRPVRGSRASIA